MAHMQRVAVRGVMVMFMMTLPALARSQTTMQLTEVLVIHVPALKPDVAPNAFETHVFTQLATTAGTPAAGPRTHLVRVDRGSRKGQYALITTARPAERSSAPAVDLGVVADGPGQRVEYELIGAEQVGPLPAIDVLGIHITRVLPDRRDAFERFIRDQVHPAVANLRPDLRLLYYKPIGGDDPGRYLAIFALTQASRDKYWPGGVDSDDLRAAFKTVQPLTKELRTYLVEGSYLADEKFAAAVFEGREWSDAVVVTPRK
jgi:hypothetical protein